MIRLPRHNYVQALRQLTVKHPGNRVTFGTDVIDTTGEVINALAYQAGAYNQRTPLMREIRRDGIEL